MSKLVLVGLAAAMVACAAPAAAQTASPPLIQVTPARPADYEARVALVRRYFEAIQFNKLMNGTMESAIEPALADESIPADKRELVRSAALAAFGIVVPQMVEASLGMYAEAFTLDELQQLVAFYESPVGRSLTAKTVMLTRQSGEMVERFTPIMEAEMMRQLCSRMDCSAVEGAPQRTKGD